MSNINLATEKIPQKKLSGVGKGLIITILGLVLVICLYLILLFMNKKVTAQVVATQDQYKSEYAKFLSSNANDVLDFKERSDLAQKLITNSKAMEDIFSQIERDMLPQIYLDKYSYNKSKNEIILSCSGDTFQNVAKQTKSFKESGYFKQVSLGNSSLSAKDNRIKFTLNLKLK